MTRVFYIYLIIFEVFLWCILSAGIANQRALDDMDGSTTRILINLKTIRIHIGQIVEENQRLKQAHTAAEN